MELYYITLLLYCLLNISFILNDCDYNGSHDLLKSCRVHINSQRACWPLAGTRQHVAHIMFAPLEGYHDHPPLYRVCWAH